MPIEPTKLLWDNIRKALDEQPWEEDPCDPYQEIRTVFIGSVFTLLPSGKYWTPWAYSNMTEEEMAADEIWWDTVQAEAGERHFSIDGGVADPCDLFVTEYRQKEQDDE